MDNIESAGCINIFSSKDSEIGERFTELWVQIINEKENNNNNNVQINVL